MKTIASAVKKGRGKRLSDYVSPLRPFRNGPDGYVVVSASGEAYVITTMRGTKIAFDLCGRCGLNVKHCKCNGGPSLPRSVEYAWDSDMAASKGEEWSYDHPNYRGSFTKRETKRNLRMTMPSFKSESASTVYTVVKKKKLSDYVDRARKSREADVKRLLRGRKR